MSRRIIYIYLLTVGICIYITNVVANNMHPENEYIVDFGVMGSRNVLMCLTKRKPEIYVTHNIPRPSYKQCTEIEMTKLVSQDNHALPP